MKKIFAIALCLVLATSVFAQQRFLTIATGGTAGTYFRSVAHLQTFGTKIFRR